MSFNIVVAPYTARIPTTPMNPQGICAKQFMYFKNVCSVLKWLGHDIVQIGTEGEEDLGTGLFIKGAKLIEIKELIKNCDFWISLDSFLQHLAHETLKPGVVIWSVSSPTIFGYPENLNLYKDEKLFRKEQHAKWLEEPYDMNKFLDFTTIVNRILIWTKEKGIDNS